ncbi:Lipoamide acyltransferase component of branched-chain alpha-keto acid dehydrogenase complex [Diplonema papillatum]|nr:Lipoamide acyltransferase component of branched-chain alpha-keto acid dehydrogenase complex [Diplonema papillatum]KAJ9444491.1 Lipoamide acyltransferase component of branched-chain alpha-keto acid dehydrogenase complex [Diplonema papillatum]KAJ9444492.1 Lipoamide acyltransferase component of branched-chain alpha-keto acid dehydrogenase complex [Diplonema papillatum]
MMLRGLRMGSNAMVRVAITPKAGFSSTTANFKIVTFPMADVGEGIKEVEVLDWFVKEGDEVEEFQKLCEIQSDKATAEVTSRYTGKIKKIYTQQGDMQQVGQGLVDIDVADDSAPEPEPKKAAAPAKAEKKAEKPEKKKKAAAGGKQVKTFPLADIGEGIKEVEVLSWYVKEGDEVEEMDKICEVQSDKATVELSTPYTGKVVKIYTQPGSMQQVGSGLIDIEVAGGAAAEEEDEAPPAKEAKSEPKPAESSAPAKASSSSSFEQTGDGRKVLATPAVRRIATENKVDLSKVNATGKGGRVTKEDILKYVSGAQSSTAAAPASGQPAATGVQYQPEDRTVKITGRTRIMVQSMTETLKIPSFGAMDEVNLNKLVVTRTALKAGAEKRGIRLSYMPFFIKAASLAMKEYPIINSTLNADCTEITYKGAHNIGIAMDTAQGLVVPNIKNVEQKTIFQIAQDLNELQKRGADNKLTGPDLQGGTFTLTNIGAIGGTYVSPIISPPQVAIGGLGSITKLPRFNAKGEIEAQNVLYISWTADHRIIDGATMVRYSQVFKNYLEEPGSMLLDMM